MNSWLLELQKWPCFGLGLRGLKMVEGSHGGGTPFERNIQKIIWLQSFSRGEGMLACWD